MAQNTVQYQRGLSMLEFFDCYGSPQQCEALVRQWRWPGGFICPRCQGNWHSEFRRQERLYFQCSACRYQCSLVSGTLFESSKLAAADLVPGHAPDDAGQEQRLGSGTQAPPGGVLPYSAWLLKHMIMQRDDASGAVAPTDRPGRDRRRLPGW